MVIPYRETDAWRALALDWVLARYERMHPDWEVIIAHYSAGKPWRKGAAVWPAIEAAQGVVVQADADVWTDGLELAVEAVGRGGAVWAMPHQDVYRLAEPATLDVIDGVEPHVRMLLAQDPYPGVPGGGYLVANAETLREAPIDPRFTGWGQEDEAHAMALYTLHGDYWHGHAPLFHLYHPPPDRLTRKRGSREGWRLRTRYREARDPEAMRTLLGEARQCLRSS